MARNRYDVSSDPQARFEPGSRNRVLANRLGIRRARDMGLAESQALELAQSAAIEAFTSEHRFTAADIRGLHRLWLGPIYDWAGEYRSVNISKGGFMFAAAGRMALQANLPPLDFSALDGRGRRFYIGGIHAAMGGDFELLTNLFERLIARTRRPFSSSTR